MPFRRLKIQFACSFACGYQKGKGYLPAEENPGAFHGIGKFDIDSGEPISSHKGFSAEFGNALCDLAEKDKKICAITAAMAKGTGLEKFSIYHKERFLMWELPRSTP